MMYAVEMAKQAMMTCTIVKVAKNSVSGEIGPIGRVAVQPLVQMVDGIQQTVAHTNVFNLPYFRLSGGSKAIIMDPKEGDIGFVVVADRDISGVKNSKKASPPGSGRKFNIADGIYISACLGDAPTCYMQFTDDEKIIISPDNGTTIVTIEKNKVTMAIGDMKIVLSPSRIDLGQEHAPNAVMTDAGPSTKIFAAI
jgi:hypothetical protein